MTDRTGYRFVQEPPTTLHGSAATSIPLWGWFEGVTPAGMPVVDGRECGVFRTGEPIPARLWGLDAIPDSATGFSAKIPLPAAAAGTRHHVRLPADDGDGIVIERVAAARPDPAARGLAPRIAVCMGVYNPPQAPFERQVASIIDQDLDDWICIVNDDGSDPDRRESIDRLEKLDPRFFVYRNDINTGFYRNFEIALDRVPDGVDYVALADQDDLWYPYKLSSLARCLDDDGVELAYSDMRIVDEHGDVIADSYWGHRLNNFRDIGWMLIANTVTGAATMLRRGLLEWLLPFPPRVGDAFHDHWIACAALASGEIGYVERPLYDYYQYGTSVIGHCGFADDAAPRARTRPANLLRLKNWRSLATRYAGASAAVYWHECRRIESICDNLALRGTPRPAFARAANLFGRGAYSAGALWLHNLMTRDSARRTDNAERRLARAYAVYAAMRRANRSPAAYRPPSGTR